MTDQIPPQPIRFDAAADCPDPAKFSQVIDRVVREYFGTAEMAAQCRQAYGATRLVPWPFARNVIAAECYQNALLAMDDYAQRWLDFVEAVNREFADIEDDGDAKTPAIPGWQPDWINFA